jgi:hypothetical protein
LQETLLIARTVLRASTGLLKDKPLKQRARPAARASTGLLQDKPQRHRARTAALASTGWLLEKPLRHRARPAMQASTGLLQDKPLKHRARPAAWARTGPLQEEPLRHRARHVPRTRPRLLRAVLVPPALASWVTVAMPAQGIARKCVETVSRPVQKDVMTATLQRATAAAQGVLSSADTTALLHSPTSAAQDAETPGALDTRDATTATASVGMDAVRIAQMLRLDGFAQLSRAEGPIARKCAETVSWPVQKDVMTATRQRATVAVLYALSSADTIALESRLCVPPRHAVTENVQALNHVTTEPP